MTGLPAAAGLAGRKDVPRSATALDALRTAVDTADAARAKCARPDVVFEDGVTLANE